MEVDFEMFGYRYDHIKYGPGTLIRFYNNPNPLPYLMKFDNLYPDFHDNQGEFAEKRYYWCSANDLDGPVALPKKKAKAKVPQDYQQAIFHQYTLADTKMFTRKKQSVYDEEGWE